MIKELGYDIIISLDEEKGAKIFKDLLKYYINNSNLKEKNIIFDIIEKTYIQIEEECNKELSKMAETYIDEDNNSMLYSTKENKNMKKFCFYCKEPILEGERFIRIDGKYYHYDPNESLNNCYFPEDSIEEDFVDEEE